MKTKKSVYILAFALLTLISCSNGLKESKKQKKNTVPSTDGNTYISLSKLKFNSARSVNPTDKDYSVEDLTDIVLKGQQQGSDEIITFNNPVNYDSLIDVLIPFSSQGKWTFTLTANKNGIVYSGQITVDIISGAVNKLAFVLTTKETYGGMSITMNFTVNNAKEGYKVIAKLMKASDTTSVIESKEFDSTAFVLVSSTATEQTYSITYTRDIQISETRLTPGTYYLTFDFINTKLSADEILSTSGNYVKVANGVTTTADLFIDVNEVYNINYHILVNGQESPDYGIQDFVTDVVPLAYSRKSPKFGLPTLSSADYLLYVDSNNDYLFNDSDLSVAATPIIDGTTGTVNYYALFINAITVSANAPSNPNVLKGQPVGSIQAAVDKIIELESTATDFINWTILVDGTLNGPQTFAPATDIEKQDIILKGKNGLGSDGKPKDKIITESGTCSLEIDITTSNSLEIQDLNISKVNVTNGNLYLSGTPIINDLSLPDNGTGHYSVCYDGDECYPGCLYLADNLSSGASITFTPNDYTTPYFDSNEGGYSYKEKFVSVEDGSGIDIANNSRYFHVTQENGSTTEWFIDEDGCLNRNCILTFVNKATNLTTTKKVSCSYFEPGDFPEPSREGYLFNGYYFKQENEHYDYSNIWNPIQLASTYEMLPFDYREDYYDEWNEFRQDTQATFVNSDMTFYATWINDSNNLYIDATNGADFAYIDENSGDETTITLGDGSSSAPYRSINHAINTIKTIDDATKEYTISVNGFTDDINLIIDENVPAKSITLQGAVATPEGQEPSCGISRNYQADDGSSTLFVSGGVPVTIKNFKFDISIYGIESDGALINVGNRGSVILDDDTFFKGYGLVLSGRLPPNGIIAVENGGSLIMNNGVTIDNYYIANGAVYVKTGGTFTMEGGTISNTESIGQGGAVCVDGGTFTMNSGAITVNHTTTQKGIYGAGVCVKSGLFKMNGGEVSNNNAYMYISYSGLTTAGGGVFVYADGSFEMTGGEISGNKALNAEGATGEPNSSMLAYGGGVCLQAAGEKVASFTMTGGTISGNTAGTAGNGIYYMGTPDAGVTGTITLGGNAIINSDNDIYLPDYMTIDIDSALAKVTSDKATIPTITPADYTRTTPLFSEATLENSTLKAEISKFEITTQNQGEANEQKWKISSEGILAADGLIAKSKPNAVGDIVLKDGTVYGNALNVDADDIPDNIKNNAVAVIFYAGTEEDTLGKRVIGLGLHNSDETNSSGFAWADSSAYGYNNKLTELLHDPSNNIYDNDGRDNWEKLCSADSTGTSTQNAATNYPAFNWVKNYATNFSVGDKYADNWFMPSAGEMSILWGTSQSTMDEVLQKLGSTIMDWYSYTWYWTSSQSSYDSQAYSRQGNNSTAKAKYYPYAVLACYDFTE